MQIHPSLATLAEPIDTLNTLAGNPRRGDIEAVARSYQRFGQRKPIVVQRSTRQVLAGNHQLAAARQLGWTNIAVLFTDDDDVTAAAFSLADNRTGDLGTYDNDLLLQMIATIESAGDVELLAATSYQDTDIAALLASVNPPKGLTDPDDVPNIPPHPYTRLGDIWTLGPHTLVCGSATDPATVQAAANGHTIDAMWTDPPYGVSYVGKTADALTIQGDTNTDLAALLTDAFAAAATVLRPGAPCYIAHADTARITFEQALTRNHYLVRQNLIWVKSAMVLGHSDYHYRHEPILETTAPNNTPLTHEPILYAFTPGGTGTLGRGGPHWTGNNNATTIFEIPKPTRSTTHPTMKPVDLITAQIKNNTRPGQHILDLFTGSGSTLIAAHHLSLTAHLTELDPHYCDVTVQRYAEHTGQTPTNNRTGKPLPKATS